MCVVSINRKAKPIIDFLEERLMENLIEIDPKNIVGKTKIFVNGSWIGVHRNPEYIINEFKA